MKQFSLEFDDRPDGGPRSVGPFGSRESAFQHAANVASAYPEFTFSYEAHPLAAPSTDRPGAKGKRIGSPVEMPK